MSDSVNTTSAHPVRYEVTDGIATITMDRPDRGNVYNWDMAEAMIEAFDRADADQSVRVLIVTGAGKYFCVGMDIDAFGDLGDDDRAKIGGYTRDGGGMFALRILQMRKPVIMAMNGSAAGIGMTMTLGADVRIAAAEGKFAFPFTRRSIAPEACSSWILPRIVGITQALEWVATGRTFRAQEGKDGRLFSYVVPAAEVMGKAREIAAEIVQNTSPLSVAASRQMLWRALEMDSPVDAHRQESEAIFKLVRGPDGVEGAQAFKEKRSPQFTSSVQKDYPFDWPTWPELPDDITN
ncbi:MAG: enoyl-CoA hydratase-related protein [Antricoccus sp.]